MLVQLFCMINEFTPLRIFITRRPLCTVEQLLTQEKLVVTTDPIIKSALEVTRLFLPRIWRVEETCDVPKS